MNVLLVSQCDKRALTETRRILDQFAERRGDRTWQTPITQAGLDTLRKLLRKTARKNTAVACHWIRGRDHSELLWVVGNASRFNAEGAVPTNTTRRNVLRRADENDWHTGEAIYLLSSLAALMHDLGKACQAFQDRLRPGAPRERNLYRHEWISLRLFQSFVGNSSDTEWLQRLIAPTPEDDVSWISRLQRDGIDAAASAPFCEMPPMARAIGWLVLTHHRLPVAPQSGADASRPMCARVLGFQSAQLRDVWAAIDAGWNERCDETDPKKIAAYWQFQHGLPVVTSRWRRSAARLATRLKVYGERADAPLWTDNLYLMHLSRLVLMLADHHYSSLEDPSLRTRGEVDYPLLANTIRSSGAPKQRLDEHLLGVAQHAALLSHALPGFEHQLPRLARHKGLVQRSRDPRYRWQDRAVDLATSMRVRSTQQGAFIVNMASTGCGKTLANAKVMNALADPQQGFRCAFALSLRTLTLQTGHAFRDLLGLADDDLAVRVGGSASRALFEHFEAVAEDHGSGSAQALMPEDSHVRFEGNLEHPLLQRIGHDPQIARLLMAPLLVCTIDHLVPATESQRGGRQIAPMLRLMSGDLVLDEPDDFDLGDLPALTRLVHWAGLLGARVLLSSATLPPALIEGLFDAYRAGRSDYQRNRGEQPGLTPTICCAWMDEFGQRQVDCPTAQDFQKAHLAFVDQRVERLGAAEVRRRGELIPIAIAAEHRHEIRREFARAALEAALKLHRDHHESDPATGKRVSFGLVRMANIVPLVDVALALYAIGAPQDTRIHLCVYHSQFPLLIRSAIERQLDDVLNRRSPSAAFSHPSVRKALDQGPEADHLFIVLGSPVTEVGRDHDYDWAVVEPSSMRSLIQLAGRVRRHRPGPCSTPNVLIFDTNLKHLERPGEAAYCRPGFESDGFKFDSHRLTDLLPEDDRSVIDARPRVQSPPAADLRPQQRWVDLEHHHLRALMLTAPVRPLTPREIRKGFQPIVAPLNASSCWQMPQAMLTGVLAQQQPFRDDDAIRDELVLRLNEDEDDVVLHRIEPGKRRFDSIFVVVENSHNHRIDDALVKGDRISPWQSVDYMEVLTALADALDMPLAQCTETFGKVTLRRREQGWRFHPALGFVDRT